jgi:hypothetical protein
MFLSMKSNQNRFKHSFRFARPVFVGFAFTASLLLWAQEELDCPLYLLSNTEASSVSPTEAFKAEFPTLSEMEKGIATEPYALKILSLHNHPGVRKLLAGLVKTESYQNLTEGDRASLFYYLSLARYKASHSKDARFVRLWQNTLDAFTSAEVTVLIKYMDGPVHGDCHDREICLNRLHLIQPDEIGSPTSDTEALESIAHEVSHAKDRFLLASPSVFLFEAEMNAWAVGFYASRERLPNQREAAIQAVFLLTSNAYPDIVKAWKSEPDRFQRYLNELGLKTVSEKAAERVSKHQPAPLWGWEGFLENAPTPPARDQMKLHLVALSHFAEGEVQQKLFSLEPPEVRSKSAGPRDGLHLRTALDLVGLTTDVSKLKTPLGRVYRIFRNSALSYASRYYLPAASLFLERAPHCFRAIHFFQPPQFPHHQSNISNAYLDRIANIDSFSSSLDLLGHILLSAPSKIRRKRLAEGLVLLAPYFEAKETEKEADRLLVDFLKYFQWKFDPNRRLDIQDFLDRTQKPK